MSNAPPTWEILVVPEGEKKISFEPDTRVPNAGTFKILREDHTLANMLRMRLLENPKVLFAGYKVPHPLEHDFLLKVQTTPDTTPQKVLQDELVNLVALLHELIKKFQDETTKFSLNK